MKPINSRRVGVASALAFAVMFAGPTAMAAQNVQGSQTSDGATATSGDSDSSSYSGFTIGASASGDDASVQASGSNSGSVKQSGKGKSGDSVAGGQVAGVVGDDATVQLSNDAIDPLAFTGDSDIDNSAHVHVGPVLEGDQLVGVQNGDNFFELAQDALGETGDAVGGSQVVGVVGSGAHTLQLTNANDCDVDGDLCSSSGDLDIDQEIDHGSIGMWLDGDGDYATATQTGDNSLVSSMVAEGVSGDALNGSQVSGVVGGSVTAQLNNDSDCDGSDDDCAASGDVDVETEIGAIEEVAIGLFIYNDGDTATGTLNGDNTADFTIGATGASGDALSGSQVTGGVGNGGDFVLQANNQADDDGAESGDVDVNNQVGYYDLYVGIWASSDDEDQFATQAGDNTLVVDASASGASGDAVAGSQVSGAVSYGASLVQSTNAGTSFSVSGDLDIDNGTDDDTVVGAIADGYDHDSYRAVATQTGDNLAEYSQTGFGSSGDALAGSQVSGIVGGTEATVQNSNASEGVADSGEVDLDNELEPYVGATAWSEGGDDVTSTQSGDNALVATQALSGFSGDAVAGGQIAGVAGTGATTALVQLTNTSEGDANGEGGAGDVDAYNDIDVWVGTQAYNEDYTDTITQNGDDSAILSQMVDVHSGDAVAASQVSGVVAGDATVQATNSPSSDGNTAESGAVDADNGIDAYIGASDYYDDQEFSYVTQNGDATLTFDQSIAAASGDALADSQVTGIVADESEVQVTNDADGSDATTGQVDADNDGDGNVGPYAEANEDAVVTWTGDAFSDGTQSLDVVTGDGVSGGQITGTVRS